MNTEHCENILGYPVTTLDQDRCVRRIHSWITSGQKRKYVVCVNPHSLKVAKTDILFRDAILNSDLVTPDGVGIIYASKILGGIIRARVTGSDIFWGLSRYLDRKTGFRYFFLGSTDDNLLRIQEKMNRECPNIEISGMHAPPFKPSFGSEDSQIMIDAINRAKPHVMWIGMTAPKQEKWVYEHLDKLDVNFIGPVGAVFAFLGGAIKRAHPILRDHGLEWLPRLFREPTRLWRRTVVSAPEFILSVLRQRMTNKYTYVEWDCSYTEHKY
jgi:N-acetylglucosaminyldiphosphoundecaprenol N-acetyl-beta-D-mannosaminyltransferase